MNRKERQELRRAALSGTVLTTALQLPQAEQAEASAEPAEQLEAPAAAQLEQFEVTAEQLEAQAQAEARPAPAEARPAPAEQLEDDAASIVRHQRALEVVHLLRSASVILRTAASIAEQVPGLGAFEQGADILSHRCTTAADQLQTKLMV